MKLYGVLLLMVTLSAAYGLKCYYCISSDPRGCRLIGNCESGANRCASAVIDGAIIKGCEKSVNCVSPIKCCQGDLCNGAIPTGSSVLLLLVSSLIAVFL
ncbi:hypothetical protein GBF38_004151 [Nibea albiflora]|uniref:Uncharacterized protein n=1 Tax=Nibea albiflora TaxID=240163 RepID=A0ACB7FBY9_NIBAL|nr:hypothetical protein GBF38_004151 [Nibea albiflora]